MEGEWREDKDLREGNTHQSATDKRGGEKASCNNQKEWQLQTRMAGNSNFKQEVRT
jgi:hypothetical protein